MSMRRKLGGLIVVLAPALVAAQQGSDGARPIALTEAVRLAQQNSPTTVQARNAEHQSEQAVRTSKAQFLPTLSLSAGASQRGGTQIIQGTPVPFSGLPWSYTRGLSTNLTLFDGGRKWYSYKNAEANLASADATEVTARYTVSLSVKQQYYNILAARESESAARRALDQSEQNLKVAAAKMAAGAATRADSLSAAVSVGNARLQILNAVNAVRNANAALTRLVGSPFPVTAVQADTSESLRIDLDEAALLSMALEGPTVKQSAAALNAARATHRSQTTPYLPSLTLSGSYGQNPVASQNFNFGSGTSTLSTSLGFNLNYTIFDGLTREQNLVNARMSESNAEANYKDQQLLAQQTLTTQLNNFRTAQQRVELQLLTIQQADEALRVVQQRYNLGTAALLEVLQAQTNLDNARAALIQARLDGRTAKANIEQLIGRDLP
jgi:outer membrane protein